MVKRQELEREKRELERRREIWEVDAEREQAEAEVKLWEQEVAEEISQVNVEFQWWMIMLVLIL